MLDHYLKTLKLPTFASTYQKLADQCRDQGEDYATFLLQLCEKEVLARHGRAVEQRMKRARFPTHKTLDSYDFKQMPELDQRRIRHLASCEYIQKHENVIALGNSGTGKTHIATSLGMAACQQGFTVYFTTAAALVHELLEAREEKKLLRLQTKLSKYGLLILDEMGYVPFSKAGAELLFEVFSSRYERGSMLITSNLPFAEWTQVFGCDRLTGALLDRLTHHVHILEMNGESYRLAQSKQKQSLQ